MSDENLIVIMVVLTVLVLLYIFGLPEGVWIP